MGSTECFINSSHGWVSKSGQLTIAGEVQGILSGKEV